MHYSLTHFIFFNAYPSFHSGIPNNMFGPFPKLASLSKKVGAYPSVRAYYAGRQGLYSSFSSVS
jgi:hypothetical protein